MKKVFFSLCAKFRDLAKRETGQDMVEYALVVALIAFGAVAGLKKLATSITTTFSTVSTTLSSDIT